MNQPLNSIPKVRLTIEVTTRATFNRVTQKWEITETKFSGPIFDDQRAQEDWDEAAALFLSDWIQGSSERSLW